MNKICLNPECQKEFTPKNPKGKYCDPKCKSAHQYLLKKYPKKVTVDKILKTVPGVTTADKIQSPTRFSPLETLLMRVGKVFTDICHQKKVTPDDALIWFEENYGKKVSVFKQKNNKPSNKDKDNRVAVDRTGVYNPFKNSRFLSKIKTSEK